MLGGPLAHLDPRLVQANEFDEGIVPGKLSAAKHQLFELTFRRAA